MTNTPDPNRLDRIEQLLEAIAISQQSTDARLDRMAVAQSASFQSIDERLDRLAIAQEATQQHLDNLALSNADLRARQIITQNQIDSLTILSADTRQAVAALLQVSVRHEGRLDDLEQGNQP